jgi:hypothetical protein
VVVFPQTPELSTGHPQVAKNRRQGYPQDFDPLPLTQNAIIHTSTTPYYD